LAIASKSPEVRALANSANYSIPSPLIVISVPKTLLKISAILSAGTPAAYKAAITYPMAATAWPLSPVITIFPSASSSNLGKLFYNIGIISF
jgi:hypothetical protein